MKRILIFCMVLSALFCSSAEATMTYGLTFYLQRRGGIGSGTSGDPLRQFINEVETTLDGTAGVTSIIYTPGTEPSSPSEGMLYYDSVANNLKLYTGAAFVDIDISGSSSLDAAYGIGQAITVDAGSVTLTATDAANNDALTVIQSDTAGASALVITNAGSGASIEIDGAGTGDDITGTGDLWTISEAGVASLVGVSVGASDIVFTEPATNDVTLLADADGILTISAGSMEDIDINLATSNTLTLTSSTAVDAVNWGSLDSHTSLSALAFDAAAGSITLTADAGTEDLTISQAGGVDASLILQSAGTGTDALSLISSAADIKMNSADNIDIDAADNIAIDTADGSLAVTVAGATNGDYTLTVGDNMVTVVTGVSTYGVDGTGFDITWYGDTASSQMLWDQNGDTNGSLILTGASQTITGIDQGGNLLTVAGIDTTGNTDSIVVTHSGSGDGLQITAGEADSVATRFIAAASQTTSLSVFDAATSNWDGADNVGMVHVTADDPLVHTGASLVAIVNSGQPIAAAEGFALRIVDTGTARTDAYAMEIETTNTTPALKLNNQLTITGADQAGVLFDITGADTTGNTDTMTMAHSGTGAALQITSSEADTQLIELISAANQTTWLQVVDGAAGNWIGADNVGMLHLKADTALAHAGAAQLMVVNSTQPITAAEGFLARFVDTGTARTNAYAVEIEVTATTGGLYSTGHATFEKGAQVLSQAVTATTDGLTTGLIPDHASFVTVTSDSAAKVVVLPAAVIGHVIRIVVPSTGAELQTLATTNATINAVDCDGTNEMAMAAASIYHLECVAANTWIAYAWGSDGAAEATIVPDTDA